MLVSRTFIQLPDLDLAGSRVEREGVSPKAKSQIKEIHASIIVEVSQVLRGSCTVESLPVRAHEEMFRPTNLGRRLPHPFDQMTQ